jgi:hypothetical protein
MGSQPYERIQPGTDQDWRTLLGRKVSIRYRLPDGPAEAIGVVMSLEEEGARVQIVGRRGEIRSVVISDIEAGKVWPIAEA